MFGHGFDRRKYTLHSTKYTVHSTQYIVHSKHYKLHSTQYRASGIPVFTRCAIQEMGSSANGELRCGVHEKRSSGGGEYTRLGVQEMESWGNGEFTRREVYEMGSWGDREFTRWGIEEMGSSADGKFRRWGLQQIGSSGVKIKGSNPGSLLRSKSTRHERSCEAASEWFVTVNSMQLCVFSRCLLELTLLSSRGNFWAKVKPKLTKPSFVNTVSS